MKDYTQTKLQICIEGRDDIVRVPGRDIKPEELQMPEMQQYFDDLIEAMLRYDGIGIASPQIGYSLNAVIIHAQYAKEYTGTDEHLVLVNPRIASESSRTRHMEEGCLSVPGKFGTIERPIKVRLKALDRHGNPVDIKTKSFLSRVLQHEVDHLRGTLYIDTATEMYDK